MSPVGKDTQDYVDGKIRNAVEAASWRWKALDTASKIAMPILLAACGWLFLSLQNEAKARQDLEGRVQVIEATRYTSKEAGEERKALAGVLSDLKSEMARSEERDKTILRRLDKIETKLEKP